MAWKKAEQSKVGGKFLSYGVEGSGKTMFGLTFPKIAIIDSEAGSIYYTGKPIKLNNGKEYDNIVLQDLTSDIDELENDLDAITDNTVGVDIHTFMVDSETKFYGTMQVAAQNVEEKRAKRKNNDVDDANISQRSWGKIKIINLKLQQAKIDLSARGIHVVSIAQEVEIKDNDNKVIGVKPDMHKSVKFDYDVILRHYSKLDTTTGEYKYYAIVMKDRTGVTKKGDKIENPSYDIWRDYYENRTNLKPTETNYKKDVENYTNSLENEALKVETIINEWKLLVTDIKNSGNIDGIKSINAFIKDKKWDITKLDSLSCSDLQGLVEFTKKFL